MLTCPICGTGLGNARVAGHDCAHRDDWACRCGLVYARFDAIGSHYSVMTVWVDVTGLAGLDSGLGHLVLRQSYPGSILVQDSVGNVLADPAAALAEYLREAACLLVMES